MADPIVLALRLKPDSLLSQPPGAGANDSLPGVFALAAADVGALGHRVAVSSAAAVVDAVCQSVGIFGEVQFRRQKQRRSEAQPSLAMAHTAHAAAAKASDPRECSSSIAPRNSEAEPTNIVPAECVDPIRLPRTEMLPINSNPVMYAAYETTCVFIGWITEWQIPWAR